MKRVAAMFLAGWSLACGAGEVEPPPTCPEAPECPAPEREVVVVPVFADDEQEHWCCAYQQDGTRRYALVDGPTACKTQYGAQDGAWTEGNECIPCCCRTPVSDTDASKGAVYELTSPVACAGVGECKNVAPEDCRGAAPAPDPEPGAGKAKSKGKAKGKGKKGGG